MYCASCNERIKILDQISTQCLHVNSLKTLFEHGKREAHRHEMWLPVNSSWQQTWRGK